MKKIMFVISFVICMGVFGDSRNVVASDYEYEVTCEPLENISEDEALYVIETEIIFNVPESEVRRINNFEEISFDNIEYFNLMMANGFRRTLFGVRLSGVFYYYDDGKVHLYSLSATTHVYEEDSHIDALSPQIYNGDGSFSEGSLSFTFASDQLGLYICRAVVEFYQNSTEANARIDVIDHMLP